MILISHRGNIDSIQPERENTKEYIDEAIDKGYDVEVDVWRIGSKMFLGHDKPEHEVDLNWLQNRKNFLWIHTKNFEALSYLFEYTGLRIFYHQKEQHTIIANSESVIWSHNISEADYNSIIPLLSEEQLLTYDVKTQNVFGICSDFVGKYGKS